MYNKHMFHWLKKHFIPHIWNDNRPHILRNTSIRYIVLGILFVEVFTFLIPTLSHMNSRDEMASVISSVLSNLTNEERVVNKEAVLIVNPILNKAAEMKANDMATEGYFAHTSPEGKTPWYWLEKVGYNYQYAGENLAVDFTDSKDVTNAWMNSPTHKSNIVKENYTEIGTGIAIGVYKGQKTIFVAQIYANPLPKVITSITPKEVVNNEKEINKITATTEQPKVLGAEIVKETTQGIDKIETIKITNPTLLQKMFASPRNTTNTILFTILGIIILTLLLNIFMRIKHLHFDLITNGFLVIAILGAIFVLNYCLSYKDVTITQSLNYSNQNK